MHAETGMVFAIERCSLHDGPGIRTTVFVKGCPLRCLWCHNPESMSPKPELYFLDERCTRCGACVASCPHSSHTITENAHTIDRGACEACGRCVQACPVGALEIKGRAMTVDEVMAEVLKDRHFYTESGGGLTISGGEPMAQYAFTRELLHSARTANIHTVIETNGHAPTERYLEVAPYVSLFLMDWKETDAERHREFTGVDNVLIRKSILALDHAGASILLRCPIIPGYNDRPDHFAGIAALANELSHVEAIEVMPYHPMGRSKSGHLGKEYPLAELDFADDEAAEEWREAIRKGTAVAVQ
ncbi:MAG: glycyl-radical enzyme activating protein [Chitinivibrionales bacterium]|nr:glycyl-radical enzyme activating protein [Chitinivibrionales bacterium]